MTKISIAPVEVFIKCHCIFVALLLGATTTTYMIACTTSPEVELSPNGTLLPLPVLDWFQMTLYKRVLVNFTKRKKKHPFCGERSSINFIFLPTTTITHSKIQWDIYLKNTNVDREMCTTFLSVFWGVWFQPKKIFISL